MKIRDYISLSPRKILDIPRGDSVRFYTLDSTYRNLRHERKRFNNFLANNSRHGQASIRRKRYPSHCRRCTTFPLTFLSRSTRSRWTFSCLLPSSLNPFAAVLTASPPTSMSHINPNVMLTSNSPPTQAQKVLQIHPITKHCLHRYYSNSSNEIPFYPTSRDTPTTGSPRL
jgi:hypothetical protein